MDNTLAATLPSGEIERFCVRNHIRKLALFGSVLTPRFRPESDIDVLVEFEPEHVPSLFDVVGMELELTEKLGRKVDLRTPGDLSRYFRDQVVAAAAVQYERN
jgi:predicted nucleotidyltransferase